MSEAVDGGGRETAETPSAPATASAPQPGVATLPDTARPPRNRRPTWRQSQQREMGLTSTDIRHGRGSGSARVPRAGLGEQGGHYRPTPDQVAELEIMAAAISITVAKDGSRTVELGAAAIPVPKKKKPKSKVKKEKSPARPKKISEATDVDDQNDAEIDPNLPPMSVSRDDLLRLAPECSHRYTATNLAYMDPQEVDQKTKAGDLLVGKIVVNGPKPWPAIVELNAPAESVGDKIVYLASATYRNRSYNGDVVAVSILQDQSAVNIRNSKAEQAGNALYAQVVAIVSGEQIKQGVSGKLRSTNKMATRLLGADKFVEFWPNDRTMPHALVPIGNVPEKFFSVDRNGKSSVKVLDPAVVDYVYWDQKVNVPFAAFQAVDKPVRAG